MGIESGIGKDSHVDRKRKRCFHRVISGIERWGLKALRFLTLTSAPDSPLDIHYSLRRLLDYLRRAGRVKAYVWCFELTKSGLRHLHVLYAGRFIPQFCLSAAWAHIHGAPIVHIEAVYGRRTSVAGYLAKYMSKAALNGRGYAWSWGWVHLGMVRVWRHFKRRMRDNWQPLPFCDVLDLWVKHIHRVRLLEAFSGVSVGSLRVLTEGGRLIYAVGGRLFDDTSHTAPFATS